MDAHARQLARACQAAEVHDLVVTRASAQARGIRSRRPFDEDLELTTDKALRALLGAALHERDQPLHALHLDLVRNEAVVHLRRLRAPSWREDESEGAVKADRVDDFKRLLEVALALARKADDDVRRQSYVCNVLADQRDAVEIALAVVGAAHRLQDPA